MILIILFLAIIGLIIAYALIVPEIKYRMTFGKWSWSDRNRPRYRTKEYKLPLKNCQHMEEFLKDYDDCLIENEEYSYKTKHLQEDFYGKTIYKFMPVYLPMEINGNEVYSKLHGEWVKVGDIDFEIPEGERNLVLIVNEYKEVRNIKVEKFKGDPYFAIYVKQKIETGN